MLGSGSGSNEHTDQAWQEWQRKSRAEKIAEIQAEARECGDEVSEEWAAEALDLATDLDSEIPHNDQEITDAPPDLV